MGHWNQLDVLINNAAIMATPLGYTPDGFEQQFATNFHLEDCHQAVLYNPEISTLTGYMPYALDINHAEQLWAIAEQLVKG